MSNVSPLFFVIPPDQDKITIPEIVFPGTSGGFQKNAVIAAELREELARGTADKMAAYEAVLDKVLSDDRLNEEETKVANEGCKFIFARLAPDENMYMKAKKVLEKLFPEKK